MKISLKKVNILYLAFSAALIIAAVGASYRAIKTAGAGESVVVMGEAHYMAKLKSIARECNYEAKCIQRNVKKQIPKKFYVHVRVYDSNDKSTYFEFACIDTTKPGHEEELQRALKAAAGY